jgi:hypothetical protein
VELVPALLLGRHRAGDRHTAEQRGALDRDHRRARDRVAEALDLGATEDACRPVTDLDAGRRLDVQAAEAPEPGDLDLGALEDRLGEVDLDATEEGDRVDLRRQRPLRVAPPKIAISWSLPDWWEVSTVNVVAGCVAGIGATGATVGGVAAGSGTRSLVIGTRSSKVRACITASSRSSCSSRVMRPSA